VKIHTVAFLMILGCTSFADEIPSATLEDRLKRLESEVGELRKENRELRQRLGLDGKAGATVIKSAGKEPVLTLGGLLQAQADFGDKGDSRFKTDHDRFYLRRARVNAAGKFLEEFDFRIELDLSGSLSETSNLRAQMTDAFINWNRFEFANVKVGQFKTPFGFEQLYSDPKLFGIERSLPNDVLTLGRDLGVQVAGSVLEKRLSYAAGVFNGTKLNNSFNDDDQFAVVGRVAGTPWQGKLFGQEAHWTLGVNGLYSDDGNLTNMPSDFGFQNTMFTGIRRGYGADTQFHLGNFDFWAEYLHCAFQTDNAIPDERFDASGWYAQGTYFLLPKKLQALVKFESFDPNREQDGNSTDMWTFGLNWYFKGDDLKLQIDYLWGDAAGQPDDKGKVLLRLQTIF